MRHRNYQSAKKRGHSGTTYHEDPREVQEEYTESKWYQEEYQKRHIDEDINEETENQDNSIFENNEIDIDEFYQSFTAQWERSDERILFSKPERLQILKRAGGICSCCGKKLNNASMTVEHIIPLSRGGTNDIANLTALCYSCNKEKGNILYIPSGIYSALIAKPRLNEMDKLFKNWFKTVSAQFNIYAYPMIAPKYNFFIDCLDSQAYERKRMVYNRQFFLQVAYVGRETKAEVEAVTGVRLKEVGQMANEINNTDDRWVAYYTIRKLSDDKILCLIGVLVDPLTKNVVIYLPWHCIQARIRRSILFFFTNSLLNILINVADVDVRRYTVVTPFKEMIDTFASPYAQIQFGTKLATFTYGDDMYGADIIIHDIFDVVSQRMREKYQKSEERA